MVQPIITNHLFDRTHFLKTIKEVGGMECSVHAETKKVQVVSLQLPQQEVEILNVENFLQVHQVMKNLISPLNLSEFHAAGRLHFFLQNWKKLTSDPFILNRAQGFQIPFLSEQSQIASPHAIPVNSEQTILVDQEIQEMLKKGAAIKPALSSQEQFPSPIFLVPKKDSEQRLVLNLKKLNQTIPYTHFKMAEPFLLKDLLQENNYMCKTGLKDVCFWTIF